MAAFRWLSVHTLKGGYHVVLSRRSDQKGLDEMVPEPLFRV